MASGTSISDRISLQFFHFYPGVLACFARSIHSMLTIRKAFLSKCVERLNRRETSFLARWFLWNIKLHCRGTGADLPIQSDEAMAMAFRWMSGLINHLYLLFYQLWHGAKPRTSPSDIVRQSQSDGYFLSGYLDRNLSTSVQHSELGMDAPWKPLGRAVFYFELSTWLFRWIHLRGLL